MSDVKKATAKNGEELVAVFHGNHPHNRDCPQCGKDIMGTGLTSLAYTFEECVCDEYPYGHLIETCWHRPCLAIREAAS